MAAHPEVRLDFSVNLNPLGLPPGVRQALHDLVSDGGVMPSQTVSAVCPTFVDPADGRQPTTTGLDRLATYPDPYSRELSQALATYHGVDPAAILVGNGATDLIHRLCAAVRPKRALVAAPTFSEYERSARVAGATIHRWRTCADNHFAIEPDFVTAITSQVDLVCLGQPNNPTGRLIEPGVLEAIRQQVAKVGAVLLVDECFLDFTETPSLVGAAASDPHLIVVRALTKSHALAGLRLGYAVGLESWLQAMAEQGPRWPVSVTAQVAGLAGLATPGWLDMTRAVVRAERTFMTDALQALGCPVVPSQANFLLFRGPADLGRRLLACGILIRSCANFAGLEFPPMDVSDQPVVSERDLAMTTSQVGWTLVESPKDAVQTSVGACPPQMIGWQGPLVSTDTMDQAQVWWRIGLKTRQDNQRLLDVLRQIIYG